MRPEGTVQLASFYFFCNNDHLNEESPFQFFDFFEEKLLSSTFAPLNILTLCGLGKLSNFFVFASLTILKRLCSFRAFSRVPNKIFPDLFPEPYHKNVADGTFGTVFAGQTTRPIKITICEMELRIIKFLKRPCLILSKFSQSQIQFFYAHTLFLS